MTDIQIQKMDWRQLVPLRHLVLRPNLPVASCHFPGDDDPRTLHIGAVDPKSQLVVGIGTFRPDVLPDQPPLFNRDGSSIDPLIRAAHQPFRLRGMAVHPEFRRQGIGEKVLAFGENHLRQLGCELLWFNAREVAFAFYKAQGYYEASPLFSIDGVGPHKVMLKRL